MTRNPMLRKLRAVLLVLILGATGLFVLRFGRRGQAAAPAATQTRIWVVDDGQLIRPTDQPATSAVWDGQTIHLAGARNEVLGLQVVVRPGSAVMAARLACEPLGNGGRVIAVNRWQVFREHVLTVKVPSQYDAGKPVPGRLGEGQYPNQLIPLKPDDSFDAPADAASALWVDLSIPADAPPGAYTGRLTLSGGGLDQALPLELQVYDLALPRETHLRNFFYYGPEQLGEFYGADAALLPAIERRYQRLAHDHRVSLATEPELSNGGFDWGAWWVRYGPYLDGSAFDSGPCRGVGANLWPVGISHESGKDDFQAAARSAVQFFGEKHLLERVYLGLWDEPGSAQDYADIRRFAGWAHEAVGRRLPVMVTEQVQPEKPGWGSLLGAVDIFCSDKSSDADMALARARGADIWVYNGGLGGGPYIDLPPLAVTVWGAAAWRWRLGGWYMWDSMYWRQKHFRVQQATDLYNDPLTFDETLRKTADGTPYRADWALRLNGDGVLFYPGKPVGYDGPVGCIRLKAFRRAAQDYEYLWLLAKAGQRDLADGFARRLCPQRNQWEPDPSNWVRVRGEMAAALKGTK